MIPIASDITGFIHKYKFVIALGFAALFAELAYAILNLSAMPMYVTYTLKKGDYLGAIISTFLLTEAVSRPWFGALGDKIGRKPLMIAGPAITAVTAYLTIRFQNPFILLGLRALDGFGSGALWPSAFAAIGDIVEEENRSTAMSVLNVTYMGGIAMGFYLGGKVNEIFQTYAASFYLVSVLLVASVLVFLFFFPAKAGKMHHAHIDLPGHELPSGFKLSNFLRSFREVPDMLVLACVTFLGTGILMPVVKLYAIQHLDLTEVQFGLAVAPVAAAMGIFAVPLGRLADMWGKTVAICWGIFACAVALWVLALSRSLILAGSAGVVIGLGFTIAFPAWMALVSSSTAPNRRGEVLGAVGMAQGLAAIVGTVAGSFIYNSDIFSFPHLGIVNYNAPFWFAAILVSIASVIAFTWVCKRHADKDRGYVKPWQKKLVLAMAVLGLLSLVSWITYRYSQPMQPETVAWQWVHELVKNKPQKAARFTVDNFGSTWNGKDASKKAAKLFVHWEKKESASYRIMAPEKAAGGRIDVPVKFVFPGNIIKMQHVLVCRTKPTEWKVCGLYSEK